MYCFIQYCMATINISIPDKLHKKIKQFAEKKDMKISSILRLGAKELIEREEAK